MSNSKDAVRKVLDQVKADNRTSLTAPEGKLVCEAQAQASPESKPASEAQAQEPMSGLDELFFNSMDVLG